MVESILQILDRLVSLVRERQADRRALFLDVIEPLFTELQPVVDDYFALFRRAEAALEQMSSAEIPISLPEIRDRREAMLRERVQVRAAAEQTSDSIGEPRIAAFVERITAFFYGVGRVPGASPSRGDRLVALWDYTGQEGFTREDLLNIIRSTLRALEEDWVAIAQAYASLRVHCLAPRRYVRGQP